MQNKNAPKIKYMFGDEQEQEDSGITGAFTRLKNLIITDSHNSRKKMDYDSIRQMKDWLYSFYTTTTGISNALIFLDERKSVVNNLDNYNFNPWKADWIYSKAYKEERKNLIHKIRENMDYKGEVSDDEDSIIKYDETQDQLNDDMVKFDRISIKEEEVPNAINDEKPMIFNKEITVGKVNIDEVSEDFAKPEPQIIKKQAKSEKQADIIKPIALDNQFLDNRLYYYNVFMKNKEIMEKKNQNLNYSSIFGYNNNVSQTHFLDDDYSLQNKYQPSSYGNLK